MEQAVGLLARTLKSHELVTDEGRAVLDVVEQYTRAWRLLLEYDERRLAEAPLHPRKPTGTLALDSARSAIRNLRQAVAERGGGAGLFGQERGDELGAILGNVEQTFDGQPLYPSVQVPTATSGSAPCCSWSTCAGTACWSARTAPSGWPTTPWWLLLF